jgi:hypothetical protein
VVDGLAVEARATKDLPANETSHLKVRKNSE